MTPDPLDEQRPAEPRALVLSPCHLFVALEVDTLATRVRQELAIPVPEALLLDNDPARLGAVCADLLKRIRRAT